MSISQNFPEEGPTLNLNFAGSKVLDPRITFARPSTSGDATYMDANGLIVTAAADEPRFDHKYENGEVESLGLLVEEQRTNLILYSNDFSQSNWTKQNSHPTPSKNAIGPDGVANSASTVYRTATNQYLYQSISGGGTYTLSAWVKSEAATGSFFMQAYNGTDGGMGQVTYTATNEWQRFKTTVSPTTNSNYYPCVPTNTNTNFYVWGAQVEVGAFPTSYIPTSGSEATRSHDRAYYENVDQTDWFSKTEGTVVFEHTDVPYDSTEGSDYPAVGFAETAGGGSNPSIQYFITKNYGAASYLVRRFHPNGDSASISTGGTGSGAPASKVGFVYKEDDYALVRNGSLVGIDTSGAVPAAYMLILGMNGITNTDRNWNAHLKNLQYYPTRLSNTVLQNLTK